MGRIKEILILDVIMPFLDLRLHTNLSGWFHQESRMLKWSSSRIKSWQKKELRGLIDDAYRYSPYYHTLFDSLCLKPNEIQTVEDLEKIPPLTKDILREQFDNILLRGKKGLHYRTSASGGSTGNPTKYIKDNNSWGFINAFNLLMWKQVGYHYGDKFLALGSSSIFPVNKRSFLHDVYYGLKGKIPFNAMNMSSETMDACLALIHKKRIHYIYGYASSVFLLAKYVEDNHLESTIDIRACFPTSEILTDVYRETIERVFKCPVSDMYGAHDGGVIAHCVKDGYKVGYNCIVQTDRKDGPGNAYLTDLTNRAFPFIRYQLGDELELGEGYNDFYNGQVLRTVIGRTSDVIRLENGHVLTGPGFTILFSKLPVRGYRIYKSGPLQITVDVVKESAYSVEDERLIHNTIRKHAGNDCEVTVTYSDHLKTSANGKNLYFLNH